MSTLAPRNDRGAQVVTLGEIVLIHDLKRQGLSVSAIARKLGLDRKTVRRHLARGMEPPVYGPRASRPRQLTAYEPYLRERIAAWPELSGKRLLREIRELGYAGCYSLLTDFLREARPPRPKPFERRFETAPGRQGQVDFAQFKTAFTDEPGVERVLWLFTMILGHSRWLWGRFCATQDLQTVLRCHIDAFAAMGGAPSELLYDRMKTAVIGESAEGVVAYNPSLVGLLSHYGAVPRACRPYRAQTKGKIERPYRYIREDFFLARSFRDLDDLNAQFEAWRISVANARVHATTRRVVAEHFAQEQPALIAHPAVPYSAVLTIERRVSREGMVSVGGNLYSVPDTTRKRVLDVQSHPKEIRIFEDGALIAVHPVLDGKNRRRVDPTHRKVSPVPVPEASAAPSGGIGCRPLSFYDAVARRLAGGRAAS
jgi:transposase